MVKIYFLRIQKLFSYKEISVMEKYIGLEGKST
jgi:hypothetical protein